MLSSRLSRRVAVVAAAAIVGMGSLTACSSTCHSPPRPKRRRREEQRAGRAIADGAVGRFVHSLGEGPAGSDSAAGNVITGGN